MGTTGIGRWITPKLPYRKAYVEPFAGMCGILLQRRKSPREIINDINGLIFVFWKCVRDKPEQLAWKINYTPKCRQTFNEAQETRQKFLSGENVDLVDIAHAVAVILTYGFSGIIESKSISFSVDWKNNTLNKFSHKISSLHNRLMDVQIEQKCALELLDELKANEDCVIYCDPPYPDKYNGYNFNINSISDFIDALKSQKSKVAVSGYDGDFDALDWHKSTFKSFLKIGEMETKRERVEALWTNFKPETQQTLFDL